MVTCQKDDKVLYTANTLYKPLKLKCSNSIVKQNYTWVGGTMQYFLSEKILSRKPYLSFSGACT